MFLFNQLLIGKGKYEEEFAPFLGTFVQDAWAMLMKMSNEARYDVV